MSKRKQTPDDILGDLLGEKNKAPVPEPAGEEEKAPEKAPEPEKTQALYYIPTELKDAVAERATRLGIPASQLVAFLFSHALERLDAGDIDPSPYLSPSTSPRFRNNLDIDDWYYSGE